MACTQCKLAAHYYRCSVVCVSVDLLVTTVSLAKTDEPIEMPFGLWTWVGRWNHVLDGGPDPHRKGGFWGSFLHRNALDCVSNKRRSSTGLHHLWAGNSASRRKHGFRTGDLAAVGVTSAAEAMRLFVGIL